jgi:hypothetical protein
VQFFSMNYMPGDHFIEFLIFYSFLAKFPPPRGSLYGTR